MFRNLAVSLIEHEVIRTTVPKAKELRRVAEPLITLAKHDTVSNRRLAFQRTGSKAAVGKLFEELGPRYVDRPGGYTRIVRAGHRAGDSAPVAVMELVDRPGQSYEDEAVEEPAAAVSPAASTDSEQASAESSEDSVVETAEQDAPEPGEESAAGEETEGDATSEPGESDRSLFGRLRSRLKKEP